MRVEFSGWQHGCDTVAAIKEIRTRAGVPLNEALGLVNRVLANEKAAVCVPGRMDALELVDALARVGIIAQVIDDPVAASVQAAHAPES